MSECLDHKKYVAYYRVSTDRQGRSGLGLDAQRDAVHKFLAERPHVLVAEKVEIESGRNADRPELADALSLCRMHRATLLIAKLDRLARSVAFVSNILESRVDFVAADFPEANRLTIHILSAVAEHEARMISERTKAALKAAKARGTVLGGDRGNLPAMASTRRSGQRQGPFATGRRASMRPRAFDRVFRQSGRTYADIAHELTHRGIPSSRGGLWSGSAVSRLLKRAGHCR